MANLLRTVVTIKIINITGGVRGGQSVLVAGSRTTDRGAGRPAAGPLLGPLGPHGPHGLRPPPRPRRPPR